MFAHLLTYKTKKLQTFKRITLKKKLIQKLNKLKGSFKNFHIINLGDKEGGIQFYMTFRLTKRQLIVLKGNICINLYLACLAL